MPPTDAEASLRQEVETMRHLLVRCRSVLGTAYRDTHASLDDASRAGVLALLISEINGALQ